MNKNLVLEVSSSRCNISLVIKQVGSKWRLYSQDGSKNLGTFDSKAEAEKHERQVNYFKSHKESAAMNIEEREFSAKQRKAAAKSGAAMKDGSYPINNVSDLHNAIQAIGRAKNPAAVKAHIKTRAKALGATDAIPDSWKESTSDIAVEAYPLYSAFRESNSDNLLKGQSFDSISSKLSSKINSNIQAGVDMDADDDGDEDRAEGAYAYVMDVWPDQVVYSMNGCLYQCDYSIGSDGEVDLGSPMEVEQAYQPVSEVKESARFVSNDYTSLQESSYDASKGELTVTVIRPGMSKNRRFYPQEVLKRDHRIFEGAKMFADHQTTKESNDRPEGSVNNWVAVMGKPWVESDGTVKAKATVVDPPFKAKLDRLNETGLLNEMGVSIRAVGEAHDKSDDSGDYKMVESLLAARSVDFVTYAGAGGRVETIESADPNDVDLISESELRKRRPDLVTLIESNINKEVKNMKTLEQQLQEAQTSFNTLKAENETLKSKVAESEKRAAQAEIGKLINESKLPQVAKDRLVKQFAEATKTDGVAEAITAEVDYLKQVAPSTLSKNNGAVDNAVESDPVKVEAALIESYKGLGLSEAEAKIAAKRR